MTDTIYALASAAGKAGIAVIRISGPDVDAVLSSFGVTELTDRQASLRKLRDGHGEVLDQALVLRFPEGHSFTGETVAELHLHGSIAVIRAVLIHIGETGHARMATPGEFTRRALLNERLDLTEVQGLADIIDAETEIQRREAMRVMSGEMSGRIGGWRAGIVRAMALVEATIDFADEDVPEDVWPEVRALLGKVLAEMETEVAGTTAARRLRDGFEVALVGAPNAGKSSLLNYLVRSDVAIVSDIPGTTRDVLENKLDISGLPIFLLDMAGLRETDDPIESLGVARALTRARNADVRVFLQEGGDIATPFPIDPEPDDIVLRTKIDIHGGSGISVVTGDGIAELLNRLHGILMIRVREAGLVTRQRDELALRSAIMRLKPLVEDDKDREPELLVENLRLAADDLQSIIGSIDVEQILDEVFASFCLGK
ncbi:MAG: tRNA uridine-5-carboxymethylaminomethyl(34) synthesis GTPase MnmE [Jannaschia sp.]